jgi:hypothetical protein
MKYLVSLLLFLAALPSLAGIPATPVMTLYKFNGDLKIPYYAVDSFAGRDVSSPAGYLTQGSSVIPCLVIRNGEPLSDDRDTPYVGFEIVVDSRQATREATARFHSAVAARQSLQVPNHHCGKDVKHVLDVRHLYALEKAPAFDPPRSGRSESGASAQSELDRIVRAFHNSAHCERANQGLVGRRAALHQAWDAFTAEQKERWPKETLARAKHLDYTMRTALFEGHLDRGCSAYGACERNVIALSVRNRARGQCLSQQGCRFPNDFQGVSSAVSQYNIWDEFLTQISRLTSCFLRDDLGSAGNAESGIYYDKLQTMYAQNLKDVERILYGSDEALPEIFPSTPLADMLALRHYYHAPAMGKCFPDYERVEYLSGAVARKGDDFALLANTRIHVDDKVGSGYRFRAFLFTEEPDRDRVEIRDSYPGFVVDGRKISLRGGQASCLPYGIPRGCNLKQIGRYRTTPSWLNAGKSLELQCRIQDRGESCDQRASTKTASVGGRCDKEMRPVTGVK